MFYWFVSKSFMLIHEVEPTLRFKGGNFFYLPCVFSPPENYMAVLFAKGQAKRGRCRFVESACYWIVGYA